MSCGVRGRCAGVTTFDFPPMKFPGFLRFPALMPACVFVAAIPSVRAAVFLPDASGNILVPLGSSGAVIEANSSLAGEKSVRWEEAPSSPFPVYRGVTEVQVNVSAPGYSIYTSMAATTDILNRNSEIIHSPDFVVHFENSTAMRAVNHSAVVAKGGSTVVNKSFISSDEAVIQFVGAGGRVENLGTIQTGTKYAIAAGDGFVLENSGWIRGAISAGAGSYVSSSGDINIGPDALNAWTIELGDAGGVGGNTVELFDSAFVDRGIHMTGSGNVVNLGDSRVSGGIYGAERINVVENGRTRIEGAITPTIIEVQKGGILAGYGNWEADIRLRAGSYIAAYPIVDLDYGLVFRGVIKIEGDVTHDVGSFIAADTYGLPDWDNRGLNNYIRSVSGVYDATHAVIDLGVWSRQGEYLIVENGGGTVLGGGNDFLFAGSSESIVAKYFATSALNDDGDLVAYIDKNYGSLPGLTDNQRSLGESLAKPVEIPFLNDKFTLLDLLDFSGLETVQNMFSAILSPVEKSFSGTALVMSRGHQLSRTVGDHLNLARGGDGTVSVPVGFTATESAPVSPILNRGNVWGSYSHDWADYDGGSNDPDFDGELNSFTVGADYRVLPNLLIGGVADGSESDTDVESLRAAVYGTFGSGSGFHFDFLAGYGVHDGDESDADSIQISVIAGYDLRKGDFKFGPFAGLEWQRVEVDGFGSGGFTASIEDYDLESIRALAGFRASAEFGRIRPYGSIAYAHEFGDDEAVATAALFGNDFRVTGASQSSAVLLTAGAKFSLMKNLNLDAGYRGDIAVGGDGLTVHGASLGLGYEF